MLGEIFSCHIRLRLSLLVLTAVSHLRDFTSHVLLSSYGQESQGMRYEERWGGGQAAQSGHSEEVTAWLATLRV